MRAAARLPPVRQLLPTHHPEMDDDEVWDALRPPGTDHLRVNFAASLDGSVTDGDGASGGLGGEGDRAVFRVLRAHADAILVGAGTARAEGYNPHRLSAALQERRAAEGRTAPAAIVVVTGSAGLDPTSPLFTHAVTPTVVLTRAAAPEDRRAALAEVAEVVLAGDDEVGLAAGLAALRARGLERILCEGGPSLLSQLLADDLVDELCLTLAPVLVGEDQCPLVRGLPEGRRLELVGALEGGGDLALRYRLR